jgi:integrase
MASRRTFGNIRKLPSGRWQASYLDPITRGRVPGESTFATKADANRWLSAAELSLQRGNALDRTGRTRTLRDYSTTWMAGKTALRPKTRELYTYLLNRHILSALGQANLTAIAPGTIRDWNAQLRSGTIADATAAKAYRLLRQILQAAVEDRLIAENPCRIKGAAAERSSERSIPSVDDVFRLADAIDPRFRAMVFLAAFGGLRRGECLGLTPGHLDLTSAPPTVTIEQSLVHTDGAGFILQPPKTEAGARTVAISQVLATELEAHLRGNPVEGSSFLFLAEADGQRSFRRCWERALEVTKIDCTFHDLRHLAGTLNAAAGATLKESMTRMGHTSPDAALRYQHAVAERDGVIAGAIDRLLDTSLPPNFSEEA